MEDTIMKKEYINPEMEIVKLNAKYQLMAGSDLGGHDEVPEEYGAREDEVIDFDNF